MPGTALVATERGNKVPALMKIAFQKAKQANGYAVKKILWRK